MDLWQQVLIETKNKSKMHQGLSDNVSNNIVNRFMIMSDDCQRISKKVKSTLCIPPREVVVLLQYCTCSSEHNDTTRMLYFNVSNCLNWKIYCDDHSSLSSTVQPQFIYELFRTCICLTSFHSSWEDMNSIN